MPAFWVKLGAIDLNCVDVLLNSTHSHIITNCTVWSITVNRKKSQGSEKPRFLKKSGFLGFIGFWSLLGLRIIFI